VTARRKLVIELDKPVDGVLAALKILNRGTVEANMNIYTLHLDIHEDIRAEVSRTITGAGELLLAWERRAVASKTRSSVYVERTVSLDVTEETSFEIRDSTAEFFNSIAL